MVECLRCLIHHILSLITYTFRENLEFVFIIIVQFMMSANIRILFWLADRSRLNTISLSSLCKLIWRQWTYKMPVRYILSSVWVRSSIFAPLSIMQYVGLYVFSSPISLVMIERIYILCLIIIIKSEVWTISRCLGLCHETMVSAVCLEHSVIHINNKIPIYLGPFVQAMKLKMNSYTKFGVNLIWWLSINIIKLFNWLVTMNERNSA